MKKIVCILISFIMLTLPLSVSAGGNRVATEYASGDLYDELPQVEPTLALVDGNLGIKAKSCVLIEPETLTVLYEQNPAEQLAPASITKIMSLLLIMEAIEGGRLSLDTVITASEHACSMGGSQIWLEPGESMTLDEMLKAIVIASANDATVAVGEAIAGSEQAFVEMMNARAAELGMSSTHFVNCTGLDADGHMTTAYDVALMSCALIKHELITNYSTVWMDSLRGGESELVNTNKLVRFYDGCIGLKTGTTSKAGHCLSAAARRDGLTLIAVVMRGDDSTARFQGAKSMLDFGFANYAFSKINAELPEGTSLSVKGGEKKNVGCEAPEQLSVLTRKGKTDIKQELYLPKSVAAPIKQGDGVGRVTVLIDGEEVGEIEIKAKETVRKRTLLMTYSWLLKALVSF